MSTSISDYTKKKLRELINKIENKNTIQNDINNKSKTTREELKEINFLLDKMINNLKK